METQICALTPLTLGVPSETESNELDGVELDSVSGEALEVKSFSSDEDGADKDSWEIGQCGLSPLSVAQTAMRSPMSVTNSPISVRTPSLLSASIRPKTADAGWPSAGMQPGSQVTSWAWVGSEFVGRGAAASSFATRPATSNDQRPATGDHRLLPRPATTDHHQRSRKPPTLWGSEFSPTANNAGSPTSHPSPTNSRFLHIGWKSPSGLNKARRARGETDNSMMSSTLEDGFVQERPVSRQLANELRRSAAMLFPRSREEGADFLCLVCFENQAKDHRLNISACKTEGHGCCRDCAAAYFKSRIQQGRVFELYCPVGAASGGCGIGEFAVEPAAATQQEVLKVLAGDRDTLDKYERFLQTKVDSSIRECPDCQHLCHPRLDVEGRPIPDMVCSKCCASFCYYHAAAHRDGSCEEYEVRLAAETKGISEAFGTKECPCCTRQTMKNGGCNHMTCQVCRCEWCWICHEVLSKRGPRGEDPISWHYSDENAESGCQQFAEAGAHPDVESVRLRRRDRRPTWFMKRCVIPVKFLCTVLLVTFVVLALLLWLLFYGITYGVVNTMCQISKGIHYCLGWKPAEGMTPARTQCLVKPTLYISVGIGSVLFIIPFVPLTILWGIIAGILCGCLWLASRTPVVRRFVAPISRHHVRFLVCAPTRAVHQFGQASLARLAERAREAQPS